jgi:hypothetical protein
MGQWVGSDFPPVDQPTSSQTIQLPAVSQPTAEYAFSSIVLPTPTRTATSLPALPADAPLDPSLLFDPSLGLPGVGPIAGSAIDRGPSRMPTRSTHGQQVSLALLRTVQQARTHYSTDQDPRSKVSAHGNVHWRGHIRASRRTECRCSCSRSYCVELDYSILLSRFG